MFFRRLLIECNIVLLLRFYFYSSDFFVLGHPLPRSAPAAGLAALLHQMLLILVSVNTSVTSCLCLRLRLRLRGPCASSRPRTQWWWCVASESSPSYQFLVKLLRYGRYLF